MKPLARREDLYGSWKRSRPQRRAVGLIAIGWQPSGKTAKHERPSFGDAKKLNTRGRGELTGNIHDMPARTMLFYMGPDVRLCAGDEIHDRGRSEQEACRLSRAATIYILNSRS